MCFMFVHFTWKDVWCGFLHVYLCRMTSLWIPGSHLWVIPPSSLLPGSSVCCRWCARACRWTAGFRRFQSVCPSSRRYLTTRRRQSSSALCMVSSTRETDWLTESLTAGQQPCLKQLQYLNESIDLTAEFPVSGSDTKNVCCFSVYFRALCFPEAVSVHQDQTRQPHRAHQLDSAGPAGSAHRRTHWCGWAAPKASIPVFPKHANWDEKWKSCTLSLIGDEPLCLCSLNSESYLNEL